jgi:hypothetical protein
VVLSLRLLQVAVCSADGALLELWRGEDSIRKRQMVWLRLLWSLKAVLATCASQDSAGQQAYCIQKQYTLEARE